MIRRYSAHLFQIATNRPITTVVVAIALTLSLFLPLGWSAWSAYQTFNQVIVNDFRLQQLGGQIVHLDEVLTMSSRMNAATGDTRWEQRYYEHEPELDQAIKEAIQIAPEAYEGEGAELTDAANQKLVAMEIESFRLVQAGQRQQALEVLFSPTYEEQKEIYAEGIERSLVSTQNRIQINLRNFAEQLILSSAIAALSLSMLLPIWWVVLQVLQRYLEARQTAERALSEAKEQLEAVLDAVPGAISWIDSGGVYIGVNRYLAGDWNLSQDAFIGKEVGFLQGNTQLARFLREFLASSKESATQTIEINIENQPRYYLVAAQKYQQGAATVSVGIDITERKQAEEGLRIAEEKYRSIFENALEGIFQSSPEGRFLNVNPALAQIYGYDSPREVLDTITDIGRQIYVDPGDRLKFQQILRDQDQVKGFEYRVYKKSGEMIWIQEDTRAVRGSNGQLLYYEGIVQNITERRQQEAALRQQLQDLKIEIDHTKRRREVAQITESGYFQSIQQEIDRLNLEEFWS